MKTTLYYRNVDSTMQEHERLCAAGGIDGRYVVRAGSQSAGRGRNKSQWFSPEGGLWLTFDLIHPNAVPSFALYIGHCLHKLLSSLFPLPDLSIKWPNDIYLGKGKLAGLLCHYKPHDSRYIIGLGINTNVNVDDALHQVNAAILSYMIGFNVSNILLTDLIVDSVDDSLEMLDEPASYLEYCNQWLYGRRCMAEVEGENVSLRGQISRIDESGCLELLTVDGSVCTINHGSLIIMD